LIDCLFICFLLQENFLSSSLPFFLFYLFIYLHGAFSARAEILITAIFGLSTSYFIFFVYFSFLKFISFFFLFILFF
tara:strand:- start:391 stop:621 length:231 start_codon:yes stop_codon:yes gene_type:complete